MLKRVNVKTAAPTFIEHKHVLRIKDGLRAKKAQLSKISLMSM